MSGETTTQAKSADREQNQAKTSTVRGFFRRGAWKQRLDACGLPPETRALVASTVQATKLRPAEKLAVADELIAHFHDADHQGVEPAAARAAFGEPAVAAKLIRRAKKRNRGWFSKLKTCVSWGIGAFVVFYAVLAIRFYSGEPEVKIDYFAKLNAATLAVPEDARAWPEVRNALIDLGFTHGSPNHDLRQRLTTSPREQAWSQTATWVEQHQEVVDRLARAATRPKLGFLASFGVKHEDRALFGPPLDSPPPEGSMDAALVTAPLLHLDALRGAALTLQADANAAAARDDQARVLRDLDAMAGLAVYAEEIPLLISHVVASSLRLLVVETVAEVLKASLDAFDDAALAALQQELSAMPFDPTPGLFGERMAIADIVQRVYTDDGRGGGRLAGVGVERMGQLSYETSLLQGNMTPLTLALVKSVSPTALLITPDRADVTALADAWFATTSADLQRPLWAGWDDPGYELLLPYVDELLGRTRNALLFQILPATHQVRVRRFRSEALRDAALLALALHRHRLATGSFPAPSTGHSQIVPTYLNEVPLDPLHGAPLRWTIRDGQPVIYSLGADGDDDGGVPPTDDLGGNDAAFAPPEEAVNGDWIAWPPQ